jgi:hypothetical protein
LPSRPRLGIVFQKAGARLAGDASETLQALPAAPCIDIERIEPGLRSYPMVTAKVVCMGLDFAAEMERVESRYPCFRSTPAEREALFGEFLLSLGRCAATEGTVPARADVQPADA